MRHTTQSLQRRVSGVLKHEKIRFALVGGVNTAVDFGILSILTIVLGAPIFIANVVSTSFALAVSYLLNKKAVFGDEGANNTQQILLFLVVTLSGLWLIQSAIIFVVGLALVSVFGDIEPIVLLFVGKLFATVASLVWNYLWYSKVVFKKGKK